MKPLYLRLDKALDDSLRAEHEHRKKTKPETTLADLVRELLREGIKRASKKRERR